MTGDELDQQWERQQKTSDVLQEVCEERERQHDKWGEQNWNNGTHSMFRPEADIARQVCETYFRLGMGNWRMILAEEVAEAFAEDDPEKLREELVQVAAVTVAWIEAIDRKKD